MKQFSPNIMTKRKKQLGLSQAQLAQRTKEVDPSGKGISDMTCSRIEKGQSDPVASSICILASALGLSPKSFFIEMEDES